MSEGNGQGTTAIVAAFAVASLASLALTAVYAFGGQPQLEGLLLGVALAGVALGLVLFAKRMLPHGHFVEPRDVVPHATAERDDAAAAFEFGAAPIERRALIAKAFLVALGSLGVAAIFPVRSLGTRPGHKLSETEWRSGRRMVTEQGRLLRPDDVNVSGVVTVFPEGHLDAADSQTLLIRLPDTVRPPGPEGWTAEGVIAFSKICTHAGCPVGLYQATTQELFCPCHQSTFSVKDGAKPTFGPATRSLPQLPIGIDDGGFLVALSDYTEPVGPGYWGRPGA